MKAMVFVGEGSRLHLKDMPVPVPLAGQVLVRVEACGVCRTDLHVVDGDLKDPLLPLVPGHEIVGRVEALGSGVSGLEIGQRVGVPWCRYVRTRGTHPIISDLEREDVSNEHRSTRDPSKTSHS